MTITVCSETKFWFFANTCNVGKLHVLEFGDEAPVDPPGDEAAGIGNFIDNTMPTLRRVIIDLA